ncbi:hypothetical protein [Spirosoma endophyticum]|uniref:Uncharacterized protein n=1 Tax=Spirosoma endophyticum TaxID=662367 RepID=A0A1I1GSM5_9BACT|nr:hypothetical protein [Spirosoma endophyticum]SFC14501.1 hypothetical protein SAMN05216167_101546 [Spirosoma endophyticum]
MTRTAMPTAATPSDTTAQPTLQVLLSQSEDEFYGSLQRIWNNVVQLEDMGIIQQENDKFVYAYRLAEAELQRAYSEKAFATLTAQVS